MGTIGPDKHHAFTHKNGQRYRYLRFLAGAKSFTKVATPQHKFNCGFLSALQMLPSTHGWPTIDRLIQGYQNLIEAGLYLISMIMGDLQKLGDSFCDANESKIASSTCTH